MADIRLEGVTKDYSDGTRAVSDLDLEIADGELVVFVGPSGCGKTTTLRMIAGLESITKGTVYIGGRAVNKVPPQDRDIAMVFQSYALYPSMSARENMAFGLRQRKVPKDERNRRIDDAARVLGIFDLLGRKPRALSGGQRQRVAMGRAIVREPQAFLMDEPLSNLDAKLRVEVRTEIARLQRELEVTTVYVTHDQTEAMTLGHRVAVMRDGVLQQVDAPQRLYEQPANVFVGEFIGSPAMNLVGADLVRDNGRLAAKFGDYTLLLPFDLLSTRPALTRFEGKRLILGIRPADLGDATLVPNAPDDQRLHAVVDIREDVGDAVFLHFAANGDGTELVARVSRATRAKEGDPVELVANPRRLHFFDPNSGLPIDGPR